MDEGLIEDASPPPPEVHQHMPSRMRTSTLPPSSLLTHRLRVPFLFDIEGAVQKVLDPSRLFAQDAAKAETRDSGLL